MSTPHAERLPDDIIFCNKKTAEFLRVGESTLERWRSQQIGPPWIKLGPGIRAKVVYRLSDIKAWLLRNRRGPMPSMPEAAE